MDYKYMNENIKSIERLDKDEFFFIKWHMTDWCNYHCPYCIQNQVDVSKTYITQDQAEDFAKKINQMLIANNITKKLFMRMLGGECTYFDLTRIINCLPLLKTLSITTNFSRELDYFKNLYLYCKSKDIKLILTCSYHKENTNFFDKAIELNNWCKENKFSKININYVISDFTDITFIEKYLNSDLKFKFEIKRKTFGILDLDENIIDWINNHNSESSNKGGYKIIYKDNSEYQVNPVSTFVQKLDFGGFITDGRLCDAGVNSIGIEANGDIYRTNCAYFIRSVGPFANLNDSEIKLPTEPIVCLNGTASNVNARCTMCFHTSVSDISNYGLFNKVKSDYNEV